MSKLPRWRRLTVLGAFLVSLFLGLIRVTHYLSFVEEVLRTTDSLELHMDDAPASSSFDILCEECKAAGVRRHFSCVERMRRWMARGTGSMQEAQMIVSGEFSECSVCNPSICLPPVSTLATVVLSSTLFTSAGSDASNNIEAHQRAMDSGTDSGSTSIQPVQVELKPQSQQVTVPSDSPGLHEALPKTTDSAHRSLSRYPRTLFGIFTTAPDQRYRAKFRELFSIHPNACALNIYRELTNEERNHCGYIYTFVVGAGGPTSPTELVDDSRSTLLVSLASSTATLAPDFSSADLTLLNIKENMEDGKSQTWLYYAAKVAKELQIDYVGKTDADSLPYLDKYFEWSASELPRSPYNSRVIAGSFFENRRWPVMANKRLSKQQREKIDSFFETFGEFFQYPLGQCYLMSIDLAEGVGDVARSKASRRFLEGVEDHDVSMMAFTAAGNKTVALKNIPFASQFWRHRVKRKRDVRRWDAIWQDEINRLKSVLRGETIEPDRHLSGRDTMKELEVGHRVAAGGNVFSWQCTDSCSCLPPRGPFYFHASYKTRDKTEWPSSWLYFRNEWQELHQNATHVFWTDAENELLASCISEAAKAKYHVFQRPIEKAAFSRSLYMYYYGGFYHDMDVYPLHNQLKLWGHYNSSILLQGRMRGANAPLALEYIVSQSPGHSFWKEYIELPLQEKNVWSTPDKGPYGPLGFSRHFQRTKDRFSNEIQVLPEQRVSPIEWNSKGLDKFPNCEKGVIRQPPEFWESFKKTTCYEELKQGGAFVVSAYTASWASWTK